MHINLSGKTALITGSSAGIGLAVAQGLAASGAHVILNGRNEEKLAHARQQLLAWYPDVEVSSLAADLSVGAQVDRLTAALPAVDILVNNSGIYGQQDFFTTDDSTWEQYWQTNVMSGVRLARALLPMMVERRWGRVVFISSDSARKIPPEMIHYGVTKTAQLALARGLAKRVAGSGVTVNSILPGPTLSDGVAALMADEVARTGKPLATLAQEFVKTQRPGSLIQRAASVEEVANLVVYVCSQQASATTGAALRVDGGIIDDIT